MKITKETVNQLVNQLKTQGVNDDDIYDLFTTSLKQKTITLDVWSMAIEAIYGNDEKEV